MARIKKTVKKQSIVCTYCLATVGYSWKNCVCCVMFFALCLKLPQLFLVTTVMVDATSALSDRTSKHNRLMKVVIGWRLVSIIFKSRTYITVLHDLGLASRQDIDVIRVS